MKEKIAYILPAFADDRGEITNVLTRMEEQFPGAGKISHIAFVTSRSGSLRGNHYHPEQHQWMYCRSGRYLAFSRQPLGNYYSSLVAGCGDPVEVQEIVQGMLHYCPPSLVHAYLFLEDTEFWSFTTDENRDQEHFPEHTIREEIIRL